MKEDPPTLFLSRSLSGWTLPAFERVGIMWLMSVAPVADAQRSERMIRLSMKFERR